MAVGPILTQDFDFSWFSVVEFCHTLYLREGDKVSILVPMAGLVQTRHYRIVILEERRSG